MKLDQKNLSHLAHLAGLSVEAVQNLEDSFCQITDMIAQISEVNTQGIEPMAHPAKLCQRLRPDEVTETNQASKLLSLAPATETGLYLVPSILD